jgi:hypothetical protein
MVLGDINAVLMPARWFQLIVFTYVSAKVRQNWARAGASPHDEVEYDDSSVFG